MNKILAIDDVMDNLIAIKAILHEFMPECGVLIAQSGPEGINIAEKEQPDTILLDIIMPEMDGYEVCKRLKKNESTSNIPIIMLTAINTDTESKIKGLKAGADVFISKPIEPNELSAQINVMLRIKYAEDKLRAEKVSLEELVEARTKDLSETNKKLRFEITGRKRAETQIQIELNEKKVLLKEIHHRVKNNMNVIISLLNLQSQNIEDKDQAMAAFEESRNRIYSMALVHEQFYKSDDFSKIDMKPYIESISRKLHHIYMHDKEIVMELNFENVLLNVNDAIPCGLILNELLTNAYKYAFLSMKTGSIKISFKTMKDGSFNLTVQDNGVGLPEDIDIENSETLGLQLVKILVEQIRGTLEIKRNKGTEFSIKFSAER